MNTSRGSGEPLVDLETQLIQVEQVPKVERIERRFNRRGQVVVVLSLIIALLSGAWAGWNSIQIAQNEARAAITEDGIASLRAANEKLRSQGLDPIPLPREGEAIDADALAAAAAALAYNQMKNDPTFRGPQGEKGDSCDSNQVGCRGPSGPRGTPGIPGEGGDTGQPGADGQAGPQGPGPTDEQVQANIAVYCNAYPTSCMGPKGDPGTPGSPGDPGPAIQSFTFTYGPEPLAVTYTCTDPDGDLNYECTTMGE
jgi:hypothetical protein